MGSHLHVRTPEDAARDVAVFHEREGDCVLSSDEALGAVDGIEDPESSLAGGFGGAAVDGVRDGVGIERGGTGGVDEDGVDERGHLGEELGALGAAEVVGGLLGDQRDVGVVDVEPVTDHRLRGEVGDGHRGIVLLLHALVRAEDVLRGDAQARREANRLARRAQRLVGEIPG